MKLNFATLGALTKIGTIVSLTIVLAGCQALAFKRPENTVTTKVRLTTDSADFMAKRGSIIEWRVFDDEDCTFGQTLGYLNLPSDAAGQSSPALMTGNSETMAGYAKNSTIEPVERVIAADKDFVFNLYRKNSQFGDVPCNLSYIVPLQPDQQYEIVFTENEKQCHLTIAKLVDAGNGKINRQSYVPFLRRAKHTCY